MSYSPAAIPAVCVDCGFIDCKCYADELIEIDEPVLYNPHSTEPEAEFEEKPYVDELDLSNDGYNMFEMSEAFDLWRD